MPPSSPVLSMDDALAVLQWYVDHGVDEAVMDTPINRLITPEKPTVHAVPSPLAPSAPPAVKVMAASEAKAEAESLAASADNLAALQDAIRRFEGLVIKKSAMNLVFGVGNPSARVMVIGDAPETDDDRTGIPFSGDIGVMTDKMFGAIGLSRNGDTPENSIYLTNLLHWRPPGNRTPLPAEIDLSLVFTLRHIEILRPRVVFLMGGLSAKAILQRSETIGKLRGQWMTIKAGGYECAAMATYHPAFLLKAQDKKADAWSDLKELSARLKEM